MNLFWIYFLVLFGLSSGQTEASKNSANVNHEVRYRSAQSGPMEISSTAWQEHRMYPVHTASRSFHHFPLASTHSRSIYNDGGKHLDYNFIRKWIPKFKRRYCGWQVNSILNFVCNGEYNGPNNRNMKFEGSISSQRDLLAQHELLLQQIHSRNDDNNDDDDDDGEEEDETKGTKVTNRGIVEECCHNKCDLNDLQMYCKHHVDVYHMTIPDERIREILGPFLRP